MQINQLTERVKKIRNAEPAAVVKQRVRESAAELSRAGDMQLRVELANEALAAYAVMLYETDADGQPANIDPRTWRLLVPAPWGNRGWKLWQMRQWESKILRSVLIDRQGEGQARPPLFDYNEEGRTWHLNRADYPTLERALFWVKHSAVKLSEWRKYAEKTREGTRNRMARLAAQRKAL
jgi:hypothetical protein